MMFKISKNAGLSLLAMFLFACSADSDANSSDEERAVYDQCLERITSTVNVWQNEDCIETDGPRSGSIVARDEAGDDYEGVGTFSLLFGADQNTSFCYNSTVLSYDQTLQLVHVNGESGHIIDLGAEASYEDIAWGQSASALGVEVSAQELDALFYSYEDPEPQMLRVDIDIQQGHTYLLRTSTEEYDLYAKLKITNYVPDELVEFDYEVLHTETPEVLCEQRADAYEAWAANPPEEITLYDEATYNDEVKSSFNVEMGTRDLVWEVDNQWHLYFDNNGLVTSGDDEIVDLGEVALTDVNALVDAPEAALEFDFYQPVVLNHTYFIESEDIRFAVQVLAHEADESVTFTWLVLE